MSRQPGIRNQDYDDKRLALVDSVATYVLHEDVFLPSFRQMAIAARTSEPTLKHYFGNRNGLVIAVIEYFSASGAPLRDELRRHFSSIEDALWDYQALASRVSRNAGFVRGHIFGIRESLADSEIFGAYVRHLVAPGVAAFAERMVRSPGGPVNYSTARTAASMVFANVLFLACRKHLLGEADPDSANPEHNYATMTNWLLNGMIADPEGNGGERPVSP